MAGESRKDEAALLEQRADVGRILDRVRGVEGRVDLLLGV